MRDRAFRFRYLRVMSTEVDLRRFVELLSGGHNDEALALARELLDGARGEPEREDAMLDAVVPLVAHPDSQVAINAALVGGSLVEAGRDAGALARALVDPVAGAVRDARPLLDWVDARNSGAEGDGERDEQDDEPGIDLGAFALEHPEAALALRALDGWYMPAAAAWSRHPRAFDDTGVDIDELIQATVALAPYSTGASFLRLLLPALREMKLVVTVPEIDEMYTLRCAGVVDFGQLYVLLSDALTAAIRRIGGSAPAAPAMLDVMRGIGPQSVESGYGADFAAYPWQAIEPDDWMPQDHRFVWMAPGGGGTTSLPADFVVGEIEPIDGVRVIALVGPNAAGARFTRAISGTRMFAGLAADVSDVRKLDEEEKRAWRARLRRRLGRVPAIDPALAPKSADAAKLAAAPKPKAASRAPAPAQEPSLLRDPLFLIIAALLVAMALMTVSGSC
jgi:hypothetical protein